MDSCIPSLSLSFRQVPPAAVPAMLDCILASTGSSPLSLFTSLIDTFPNIIEEINSSEKLDSDHCNYICSFVGALCHLLKKPGVDLNAMKSFIWRILIPLMKLLQVYDHATVNEGLASFFDVVVERNSWGVIEATLVPYFLKAVGLSMGMRKSEELAICKWSTEEPLTPMEIINKELHISCHILSLIIDAALDTDNAAKNGDSLQTFTQNFLWDLCNVTVQMLSQSLEHRSCAISLFIPLIFKAFISHHYFHVSVCGQKLIFSREQFFMKIWKCCKTLFSLGTFERRDAYAILSLYVTMFPCTDEYNEDVEVGTNNDTFDLGAEKEFRDEIKRGLVDKEGLVRKQSLYILKTITNASAESEQNGAALEAMKNEKNSVSGGMTKRGRWAEKEAKSMGVGKIYDSVDFHLNSQQKWGAFFLLYEMLEEYGTHLVEAAWIHQITSLLHIASQCDNFMEPISAGPQCYRMETLEEIFNWLTVLWERGFCHDNPQVRCLIMQSFLGIEWMKYGNCAKLVPQDFLLGPFIQGLNDPVHHKDFGIKGVYSSLMIEGANKFLRQYSSVLSLREQIGFLINLASVAKRYSFGRAGLMSFTECIASAALGVQTSTSGSFQNEKAELLDVLRFIMESSKQHFNHNYRLKVCEKILDAASLVMHVIDVPVELLLNFISSLPQESTNYGGLLRVKVQQWFWACDGKNCTLVPLLKRLGDFPKRFVNLQYSDDETTTYDDEDLDIWELQAKRWARVLFLAIKEENDLDATLMFFQNHAADLCKQNSHLNWLPVKYLILISSVISELQMMKEKTAALEEKRRDELGLSLTERESQSSTMKFTNIFGKFVELFAFILEDLVSFAKLSSSVFWANKAVEDTKLPGSIRGKLGGPSQRRLSSFTTSVILQAITSIKTLASLSSWCSQSMSNASVDSGLAYLWQLSWKIIQPLSCNLESEAETCIAAYEALAYVLKALVPVFSPLALDTLNGKSNNSLLPNAESKPVLDSFVQTFLQNINDIIAVGNLVRTRRAVLINWKWTCLESLLSIPNYAIQNGVELSTCNYYFSEITVKWIFDDLIDSLENASEGSIMPLLRSIRLVLELFASGCKGSILSTCDGVDTQMMWNLVRSSWILHISCNKRRVAPIAALLSAVLHHSVFSKDPMHEIDNDAPGPLKWLVEKIIEEGTRSPRTIRLAALHLTGLWLSSPTTIKYYMKELKKLTLYGSVASDEDFEAELHENSDARSEVAILAKSPDPELTEVFINTELYARVSVAVLFNKLADLADMIGSKNESENSHAAREAGKMFLLELLDTMVNGKDLAKELYKKYSAIHRRKVRVWQMICILSRFIDQDIVQKVTNSLHISLYRTNLPGVRQYLETFAIYIYLKFPSLVGEQLVPLLRSYDMRPQALSSYVFIAANIILHATNEVQSRHLDELLPPIVPLLTSHHHTLRGFTQLLVYQVLSKLLPDLDSSALIPLSLEKRCFVDLKSYLEDNSDCSRLRASMEGYLDDFNPMDSITPAGIFTNRVEENEFECVPTSLMEEVVNFLNDAREDLRSSMAKDAEILKNEQFKVDGKSKSNGEELLLKDISLDFQKKITLYKHENQEADFGFLFGSNGTYKSLIDVGKEDELLDQLLHSRSVAVEKLRAGRQEFILVASLLDRIPNLAGLARTCEIFKASALAIADKNVLHDKQFQLISVTAEKWVPILEVPVSSVKLFLEKKKREGFSILGLEQTANSIPLDQYRYPKKTVLVLGREKEGIPVELIHILDTCIEIPQLGVIRSLNVHVSGAIALWEYTRQQRLL